MIEAGILDRFRLDDRLAVVTGASKGIGRACALALAEAGADVALIARDTEGLKAVAHEIEQRGRRAHVLARDVTDTDGVAADLADLPRLDVLVNNAGTNSPQPFLEVDSETFDHLFAINVRAAFFIAQVVARRMKADGGGSIIQMSSQAGHTGLRDRTVYCATKFALEGMTRAMAVDLQGSGIRVNTVAPTFVHTEMTAAQLERSEFRNYVNAHILTGKLAEMNEVAAAVIYLASDAASSTTGTSIGVDGGWLAH
jgi:NAD(P)-dependent dehydrogenase (short-subunit alcohol dehydrogenase family)